VGDGHHRRRRNTAPGAALAVALLTGATSVVAQQVDSSTRRVTGEPPHTILALGDVSTGNQQHDAISHALATVEALGLRAKLFNTVIRTDTQLVTRGAIAAATGTLTYYKNLDDFDAVLLFIEGNPPLTPQQKSDLLAFVQSGKGLVAIHSTVAAFDSWPAFRDLLGIHGYSPLLEESMDREVAISRSRFFPEPFRISERLVPVTLKKNARVLGSSHGVPAVWTISYGKGRVFVSQLGHNDESWDREDVQRMVLEAARWTIGDGAGARAVRTRTSTPAASVADRLPASSSH
jgi:type 1 glutamine amidotransferase